MTDYSQSSVMGRQRVENVFIPAYEDKKANVDLKNEQKFSRLSSFYYVPNWNPDTTYLTSTDLD